MKKVIKASIILWCAFFASGCSGDESMEAVPQEEEASRITLFIPGAEEVRVYSTATADENRIEDCFVVVFKDGYKNSEKVKVADIVANGEASALLPQLSIKFEAGDTVYVVCNTGRTALPANIASITANDINATFPPAKAYYFSGEALPMSGRTVWSPTASTVVTLMRAVAKVQVRLGETFSIGNLEYTYPYNNNMPWDPDFFKANLDLCGFAVGNYGGRSDILQPPSGLSRTLSDSTGLYGAFEKTIRLMQYATADEMAVYVSEYPYSTVDCEGDPIADNVFNDKRQYLLMIDRIDNNNVPGNDQGLLGTAGYWRLDFYDAASKKYLDIKRNHTYTFTINKIRSMPHISLGGNLTSSGLGILTLPELFQLFKEQSIDLSVLHTPGSNIEYTIEVKEDWANAVYSNGQYAILVSADTINDGNIHLPFYLKAYIPAGVDHTQIPTVAFGEYGEGELNIRDKDDWEMFSIGDPIKLYLNGVQFSGMERFPIDGTTNILTFDWNPSHLNASRLDNGSLYLRIGNIYKRIPIMLTATP
jgi:hypothetical protein